MQSSARVRTQGQLMATTKVNLSTVLVLRDDSRESRARRFMEDVGPAMSEDEHQLRRGMAGYICEHVYNMNFDGGSILVDPCSGELMDHERLRIIEAMQSAIGRCGLTVSVAFDRLTCRLHVDIEPRIWPGPPWEVEARERAAQWRWEEYLARETTMFEGQDR